MRDLQRQYRNVNQKTREIWPVQAILQSTILVSDKLVGQPQVYADLACRKVETTLCRQFSSILTAWAKLAWDCRSSPPKKGNQCFAPMFALAKWMGERASLRLSFR